MSALQLFNSIFHRRQERYEMELRMLLAKTCKRSNQTMAVFILEDFKDGKRALTCVSKGVSVKIVIKDRRLKLTYREILKKKRKGA